MIPSKAITGARVILNDPAGATPRWSDPVLLGYFNDFMRALALARGEHFTEQATITLVAGEVQSVSKTATLGIVDVLKNKSGEYTREVDATEMGIQARGWGKVASKPFRVWTRLKGDLFRFNVYPPALAGDTALVAVTALPGEVAMGQINADNGISPVFTASAENFIAGRALTINTNAADTAKGTQLLQMAVQLGGGV